MGKCFLFDLYGTLIDIKTDEDSPEFWREIAKMLPLTPTLLKSLYGDLCNREREKVGVFGEIELENVFQAMIEETGAKVERAKLIEVFRERSVIKCRAFPLVKEMLCDLKRRGAGIYLLSNAQACFTRREIADCGLYECFDGIVLSSELGYKKPSRQFFEGATARLCLNREQCVYVGNDLNDDVKGAHGVNMRCVYIETEQSGHYEEEIIPDYVADNFEDLHKILSALMKEV